MAEPRLPEDPTEGFPVVGQRSMSGLTGSASASGQRTMRLVRLYDSPTAIIGSKKRRSLRAKIIMGSAD